MHQDRSEGLNGDPYEVKLAYVRSLVWSSKVAFGRIAEDANLNVATVSNLAYGTTAKPHDKTVDQILKALGFRQAIVPLLASPSEEVKPKQHWPGDLVSRRKARRLKYRKRHAK